MDILGIEGPIVVIVRNAAWLLAFSSVYLTLLGFFPYVIGSLLFRFVRLKFDALCPNCVEDFTLKRLWNKVETLSAELNPPLQCMDFLLIAMGYVTIILVIFGLDLLLSQIRSIRLLDGIQVVADPFRQLTIMVKVGVLLITRIFILPITLGSAIVTLVSYQVLDFTLDTWAQFLTQNCVSMYGICWIAGITFMLSMTVSVLQLREVLHPDIFAKLIKPQEAHHDLIASLIQESGLVHAKRMVVSLLVYALLLQMIIGTPLQLFNLFRHSYAHWITATTPAWQAGLLSSLHLFPTDFFQLKVWYWLPELQIPFELILGHITFLTVLDQKKDLVGQVIEVGPPLVRPPPGWDVRGHGARWAWINETPSAIERNVAPRVIPSQWLWRTCLLIGISWCLSIVVALFLMVVPLQVGRSLSQLLCVPLAWQHDPLHFIVGLFVVKYALDTVEHTSTWVTVWEKLPTLRQQVPGRLWLRQLPPLQQAAGNAETAAATGTNNRFETDYNDEHLRNALQLIEDEEMAERLMVEEVAAMENNEWVGDRFSGAMFGAIFDSLIEPPLVAADHHGQQHQQQQNDALANATQAARIIADNVADRVPAADTTNQPTLRAIGGHDQNVHNAAIEGPALQMIPELLARPLPAGATKAGMLAEIHAAFAAW
eukprot:gene7298-5251_t